MGYTCPIAVRPVLIPFSDYAKKPTQEIIDRYDNDGYVNFIFVGRIAPNKKQEDVIRAFSCYQRFCNPKSRLIWLVRGRVQSPIIGGFVGIQQPCRRKMYCLPDIFRFRIFWHIIMLRTCSYV